MKSLQRGHFIGTKQDDPKWHEWKSWRDREMMSVTQKGSLITLGTQNDKDQLLKNLTLNQRNICIILLGVSSLTVSVSSV